MFRKLLIANRGEIACRIARTARKLNIPTVAVHSDADAGALHVQMADEAVHLGPSPAAESYIHMDRVLEAIRSTGADAVHPGYGFLSERAAFAEALEGMGVAFVGPPARAIEAMGDKITSKRIASEAGVSTVPGHMGLIADPDEAVRIAQEIGYPVMIKASAGGGGKGMRVAHDDAEAREGFERARSEAASSFGDDRIFIEKFVVEPRHVEIQVMSDGDTCLYLAERDCSIQRRNQKVVEEAPAPGLRPETRRAMGEEAVALAQAVGYRSAGTVEFIMDRDQNFYFLEMNTRLQVEHPVTELITGLDLVEQMLRIAAGEKLALSQADVTVTGHAVESRIYAEDPYRNFLPSIGRLTRFRPPAVPSEDPGRDAPFARVDTGVVEGGEISMFYDPMIAKLCTWAPTREAAIDAMAEALDAFELEGIGHNLPFLSAVMGHPRFREARLATSYIAEEFPGGFQGVMPGQGDLRRLAAVAAAVTGRLAAREAAVSGQMRQRARPAEVAWHVALGEAAFDVTVPRGASARSVTVDGQPLALTLDWRPGGRLATATVEGRAMTLKIDPLTEGVRLRWRGADLVAVVRPPHIAALAVHMPVREAADTAKLLLCPMPGLMVRLDVEEGQAVEAGQPLCVVEAMKMENVLKAERPGTVAKINARPGASLAVDEVILEFE